MKNELDEKIVTKYFLLLLETYCYFIDDGSGDKKTKSTKEKVCHKKNLNLKIL